MPDISEAGDRSFSFSDLFPAFEIVGKCHFLPPDADFDIDDGVMLVCKYLQAYETGTLDQLCSPCKFSYLHLFALHVELGELVLASKFACVTVISLICSQKEEGQASFDWRR